MKIKNTAVDRAFIAVNYTLLTLCFLLVLYPLYYVVCASVSDPVEVNLGHVFLYPRGFSMEGYHKVFAYQPVWIGYRNTIFYTVVGTAISLAVTLSCAYALTRKELLGRGFFMMVITITMFFGGGLIPTYLVVREMHMINTVWAILLLGATSAYNIIVTRTFMGSSIPGEIQESAMIDGATDFGIFFRIVLPLSMPIIAVMTLFFGVGRWNSYFNELIYLNDSKLYSLQLYLREILVRNQISEIMSAEDAEAAAEQARVAEIMKFSLIIVSTVPIMCVYPFLQKFFIKGVMLGAVKG